MVANPETAQALRTLQFNATALLITAVLLAASGLLQTLWGKRRAGTGLGVLMLIQAVVLFLASFCARDLVVLFEGLSLALPLPLKLALMLGRYPGYYVPAGLGLMGGITLLTSREWPVAPPFLLYLPVLLASGAEVLVALGLNAARSLLMLM